MVGVYTTDNGVVGEYTAGMVNKGAQQQGSTPSKGSMKGLTARRYIA